MMTTLANFFVCELEEPSNLDEVRTVHSGTTHLAGFEVQS